jgi:hypothetical protein
MDFSGVAKDLHATAVRIESIYNGEEERIKLELRSLLDRLNPLVAPPVATTVSEPAAETAAPTEPAPPLSE